MKYKYKEKCEYRWDISLEKTDLLLKSFCPVPFPHHGQLKSLCPRAHALLGSQLTQLPARRLPALVPGSVANLADGQSDAKPALEVADLLLPQRSRIFSFFLTSEPK